MPAPRERATLQAGMRVAAAAQLALEMLLATTAGAASSGKKPACAELYHEQKWLNNDDVHNWDYKIKVMPWTVFGHVTVKLHGIDMRVNHIYGADGPLGGSTFTANLNAVGGAGCDDCFEISGSGQPSEKPTLSCSGLQEVGHAHITPHALPILTCTCACAVRVRTRAAK